VKEPEVAWLKRILKGLGVVVVLLVVVGGAFAYSKVSAFDASIDKIYDVPIPVLVRSTDPLVLARGKHLAESVARCANGDCHGPDMAGGKVIAMGPLGTMTGPNITEGGLGAAYTDGELARLVRHAVKKDGRSVRFMPSMDFNWLPESDVVAVVSFVRSLPPRDKPNGTMHVGFLGKILDRQDLLPMDIARRIDHANVELAPPAAPTADFGRYLGRACDSCHGKTQSGGRIPGAPASFPVPLNITPHETGIKGWTYDDFDRLLVQGIRKNGKQLDPFMPIDAFGKYDDVEKRALFAYLMALPPTPFGGR
jgi:hypothetical protein